MELDFFKINTPKDIQKKIVENVKARRKEMKLTQEEFAKKNGGEFRIY